MTPVVQSHYGRPVSTERECGQRRKTDIERPEFGKVDAE
jgi:hypothetical protein